MITQVPGFLLAASLLSWSGSAPPQQAGGVDLSLATQAVQLLKDKDVLCKQQRMIEQGVAKRRILSQAAPDKNSIFASPGARHTILKRANALHTFDGSMFLLRQPSGRRRIGSVKFRQLLLWNFFSGIRLAKHVVGMEKLHNPLRRCKSGCEQLASKAAIVKQAEALAVGHLESSTIFCIGGRRCMEPCF